MIWIQLFVYICGTKLLKQSKMKKRILVLMIAAASVCSCNFFSSKTAEEPTVATDSIRTISQVLEMAAQNLDSVVTVQGNVKLVCTETGKVCVIVDEQGNTLNVESADSLVVFNTEMTGKTINVKGLIKENRVTAEEVTAMVAAQEAAPEAEKCAATAEKIATMQEWMKANEKDYYVSYFVLASEVTVVEAVATEVVEATETEAETTEAAE